MRRRKNSFNKMYLILVMERKKKEEDEKKKQKNIYSQSIYFILFMLMQSNSSSSFIIIRNNPYSYIPCMWFPFCMHNMPYKAIQQSFSSSSFLHPPFFLFIIDRLAIIDFTLELINTKEKTFFDLLILSFFLLLTTNRLCFTHLPQILFLPFSCINNHWLCVHLICINLTIQHVFSTSCQARAFFCTW